MVLLKPELLVVQVLEGKAIEDKEKKLLKNIRYGNQLSR